MRSMSSIAHFQAKGEFLFGLDPVLNALRVGARKPHVLYLLDKDINKPLRTGINELENICRDKNVLVRKTDANMMRRMLKDAGPHNGVALDCDLLQENYIQDIELKSEPGKKKVWVLLDEINDPQNLGSLLRSCLFFGVSGVILPKRRSASLSPTVSKASAGAMEVIPIFSCGSVTKLLSGLKNTHKLVGMGLQEKSVLVSSLELNSSSQDMIIIMGNESTGLSESVKSMCDQIVAIRSFTAEGSRTASKIHSIDSLNVSNALAIVLYQLLGK